MEPDRISCLPSHVIDQILSCLPIQEAVRTSVLSTKWRYRWTTLPDLVFDRQCVSEALEDESVIGDKLARIIGHVLLLHSGPINKIKISRIDLNNMTDIDCWVLYVSRRSVNEFVLEIWGAERYRTPSCLFARQSIVNLKLVNCMLKPPSIFQGFRKLKSLDLQYVTLAQDVFENLIPSCPLLEWLRLWHCDGFTHLNIDAPNLQHLETDGKFKDVSLKNTFRLAVVSIGWDLNFEIDQHRSCGNSSNLINFSVHLPHLRSLEVERYFLKYLAVGIVPLELPRPCIDLNYLSVTIDFDDSKEVSAALCLLKSSPNLQELVIWDRTEDRSEEQTVLGTHTYCWQDDYGSCQFMQLRFVRMEVISRVKPVIDFIRLLLIDSPVLERMIVLPFGCARFDEILQFKRASASAEIHFHDPLSSFLDL